MSKSKLILLLTTYFIFCAATLKAQESEPNGYYASLYGSVDLMASNHPDLVADGFFDYSLNGFFTAGVEAGKYFGKNHFHLSLNRGWADIYRSIQDEEIEPMNNEVELENSLSVALSYRQQISRIKETNRIVINLGSRITTMFYHYSGVKAVRHDNQDSGSPTYTFDDFGMNTFGIEGAPYIEIGQQSPGKMGVFLNYELLYFRVNYQGGSIGIHRVAIILKF